METRRETNKRRFYCSYCSHACDNYSNLLKHFTLEHPHVEKTVIKCDLCSENFGSREGLRRHKRIKHPRLNVKNSVSCLDCHVDLNSIKDLREHLKSHDYDMDSIKYEFDTMNEFTCWKEKLEKDTNSFYTNRYGDRNYRILYLCNRTGRYKSKSTGQRRLKSQGSCKLNGHCTSAIEVSKTETKLQVEYWPTHYGHLIDINHLGHLRISMYDRKIIEGKIAAGVTTRKILKEMKESAGQHVNRLHGISLKDVKNIKMRLQSQDKINDESSDSDELVQDTRDGILLLYKRMYTDHEVLGRDSFAVGFYTPYQQSCFVDLGSHVICFDSMTESNCFELISMLVLNREGVALPVAWLITNYLDSSVITLFLEAIRDNLKETGLSMPQPRFLMSDLTSQYYDAWANVCGGYPIRLACMWETQREMKKALSLITDPNVQNNIFHCLCTIKMDVDVCRAVEAALDLGKELLSSEATRDFGEYFKNNWITNVEQWVAIGRLRALFTPNFTQEMFSKWTKKNSEKKDSNTRLDKLVFALLDYAKENMIQSINKEMKNTRSKKVNGIRKKHDSSLNCSMKRVKISGGGWAVQSEAPVLEHSVNEEQLPCPYSGGCHLRCEPCGVCAHQYSCSCLDIKGENIICEHIHLVARWRRELLEEQEQGRCLEVWGEVEVASQELIDSDLMEYIHCEEDIHHQMELQELEAPQLEDKFHLEHGAENILQDNMEHGPDIINSPCKVPTKKQLSDMCDDLKRLVEGLSDGDDLLISLGVKLRDAMAYSEAMLGNTNSPVATSDPSLAKPGAAPKPNCDSEATAVREHCYSLKPGHSGLVAPSELTLALMRLLFHPKSVERLPYGGVLSLRDLSVSEEQMPVLAAKTLLQIGAASMQEWCTPDCYRLVSSWESLLQNACAECLSSVKGCHNKILCNECGLQYHEGCVTQGEGNDILCSYCGS